MTDRPYTDADLRHEPARQLALSADETDLRGIGDCMEAAKIPSRNDVQWGQLPDAEWTAAYQAIDDLITDAVDVSAWAVTLGAAGLKPVTEMGIRLTTGGYPLAVQIAVDPEITDAARAELITALTEAINTTAARVLGCIAVDPAVTR